MRDATKENERTAAREVATALARTIERLAGEVALAAAEGIDASDLRARVDQVLEQWTERVKGWRPGAWASTK